MLQSLNTSAVQHSSGQNAGFVALCCCANKLAAVLCHCICTYQVWPSTQVCVHQTPVQRSTLEGKMQALLLCAAVQTSWQQCCATAFAPIKFLYLHKCCNHKTPVRCRTLQNAGFVALCCYANKLAAVSCHCICTYQVWLSTQMLQSLNTSAVQHSSGQNAGFVALCCYANKLAAVLCHCICTYQVRLSTQVCVHQTPVRCSTLQVKMQALLLCVAMQTSWQQCCATAFPPIKFGYPHRCVLTKTPVHCSTLQGKMQALLLCVAVQTSWQQCCATAFAPIKFDYPHRCAITKHQCSAALFRAKCMPCCSVLLCKQAGSSFVPLHLHLSNLTTHTDVQSPNTSAVQHSSGQNACLVALCCCENKLAAVSCHCIYTYQV